MLRQILTFAVATLWVAGAWAGNKGPSVSMTAPVANAKFSVPATITISASATDPDGTVAKVDFFQGTTLIGTRTAAPYTVTWSDMAAGSYSLTARATDNAGATKTSSPVAVTVTAPRLAIGSPVAGDLVYGATALVSGTFTGDASSTILVDNGNTTRLATIEGSTFSATLPIVTGPNALRVTVARRDKTVDTASVNITGNMNPLVAFTAPATTSLDSAVPITFAVDALSPAGGLAAVDFFRDGVWQKKLTSPPYAFVWANPLVGSHTVSATATDTKGYASTSSLSVVVSGTNALPVVSLTTPANGIALAAPASVALTASASDADGTVSRVDFLQNGAIVATTNVAPYAATLNGVAAGTYVLTARATDNRSGVGVSAPVTITVTAQNAPPVVAITAPSDGSRFIAPASLTLSANASDADGHVARVDFYQGTTMIGTASSAPFVANWPGVAAGSYVLTARAVDDRGAATISAPIAVLVSANIAPTVSLTSPTPNSAFFLPATIVVTAVAADADGAIARVDYLDGAAVIGTSTSAPYTFNWTNATAGNHTLTARAVDNAGAATTSSPVTISVAANGIAIDAPADQATLDDDIVNVSGTVQTASNSGVTVNGVVAAMSGNRFYANGVELQRGANTIVVTVTPPDGMASSRSITVVSTGSKSVRVSAAPSQGLAPLNVTIDVGTTLPDVAIAKMEVDADGNGTFDQTIDAGPWTSTISYPAAGTANLGVRVTDTSGTIHLRTIPIVIMDRVALDQMLRQIWSGLKSALIGGNKAGALRFLDAAAAQRYAPVFDLLLPNMQQIVPTFSDLQPVGLSDGFGEYAINRTIGGQNRLFFIYFGQNGDGVWRLGSM